MLDKLSALLFVAFGALVAAAAGALFVGGLLSLFLPTAAALIVSAATVGAAAFVGLDGADAFRDVVIAARKD